MEGSSSKEFILKNFITDGYVLYIVYFILGYVQKPDLYISRAYRPKCSH
jgi:hypothetical protein